MIMKPLAETYTEIKNARCASYWERGVVKYAVEVLEKWEHIPRSPCVPCPCTKAELEKALLLGASDWREYSYSGRSLYKDNSIRNRLLSPSQLKDRSGGGIRNGGTWYDVQARALEQAFRLISRYALKDWTFENIKR